MKKEQPQLHHNDPFFVVGTPRSGTTMLAVLLDRHSKIAIPPETQFFTEFLPKDIQEVGLESRADKIQYALNFKRIKDLGLTFEEVFQNFKHADNTFPELLRAILVSYTQKHNKQIFGEKSPKHIEHVPQIFGYFPKAKIICVVRDGRDVVRSLLNVPWAHPSNPRRFWLFCIEWNEHAFLIKKYMETYPQDRFILVKYEDILRDPEKQLKKICSFLGQNFEKKQLEPTPTSKVVPKWEQSWKQKASNMLDPNRIQAWRTSKDKEQIWAMNIMMGDALQMMGYGDTDLFDCPLLIRFKLFGQKIPTLKFIKPFSLMALKVLRLARLIK